MALPPASPPAPRPDAPSALPPGTLLHGQFEVRSVLGVGGFGIVYLAFDRALEREVAVKEYMPAALAGRTATLHVSLRSSSDAETFALGLKSFVNEARLLARFDHPALLKVYQFWEDHGTAYMAMPLLPGRTLKDQRSDTGQPPDEAWLRATLEPLLGALECLHGEGVYHRDISPDNVQLMPDGRPVLMDFGAARRVIVDRSQTLTAILKPAYAPIEQYAEAGSVRQGPWTDLYGLGATLHYLLLGRPPPPATARTLHDDMPPLAEQGVQGFGEPLLRIIDWMLMPRPSDRPQSVAQLREALAGQRLPPRRQVAAAPPAAAAWERTVLMPGAGQPPAGEPPPPGGTSAASPAPAHPDLAPAPPPPASSPLPEPRRGGLRAGPVVAGVVVLIAAAALAALWRAQRPSADGASAVQASASAASSVAAAASQLPGMAAALPPAAASAVPESRIAQVVLPGAQVPPPGAVRPAPPVTPSPAREAGGPLRPDAAGGQRPVPGPTQGAGAGATTAPASLPAPAAAGERPPSTATLPAAPPRSQSLQAPVAREPATTQAAPAAPATQPAGPDAGRNPPARATAAAPGTAPTERRGPESTCAGRNMLSHFVCMERECLRSENRDHPDCKAWHRAARTGQP